METHILHALVMLTIIKGATATILNCRMYGAIPSLGMGHSVIAQGLLRMILIPCLKLKPPCPSITIAILLILTLHFLHHHIGTVAVSHLFHHWAGGLANGHVSSMLRSNQSLHVALGASCCG